MALSFNISIHQQLMAHSIWLQSGRGVFLLKVVAGGVISGINTCVLADSVKGLTSNDLHASPNQ